MTSGTEGYAPWEITSVAVLMRTPWSWVESGLVKMSIIPSTTSLSGGTVLETFSTNISVMGVAVLWVLKEI